MKNSGITLDQAADYLRIHRGKDIVVKVGGACLERTGLRREIARQLGIVDACGARLIVVHGGGPQTDELQRAFGEEPAKRGGRRITSAAALRALRMATVGEVNGDLCQALRSHGVRAIGAGAGSFVSARRRPPIQMDGELVDFGEVGDIDDVDVASLRALQDAGSVPVVCPPARNVKEEGGFLNVNADLLASRIATALGAAKLVLCTDAAGILIDPEDSTSVVSTLSLEELNRMETEGSLRGGMKVKAASIRHALQRGVPRVHVVSGTSRGALLGELFTTQGAGTLLTLEAETAPSVEQALEEVQL